MVVETEVFGASHDLATRPDCGLPGWADEYCAEVAHGLKCASDDADCVRQHGGLPLQQSHPTRVQEPTSTSRQPLEALPVVPRYLFRIAADDTISEVGHGNLRSLALPARDGRTALGADAGFARAFWDAVQEVRHIGTPRRVEYVEYKGYSAGHAAFYEVWLAPTGAHDLIGIVRPATGSKAVVAALRPREEAQHGMITALWEATQHLQAERDRLLQLATRDCLTGVWNRQAIFELLGKTLASAQRERRPVTVMMADIDRFKSINDRFGHPAGDAVLQEIARRLQACVRCSDEVGRFGGEEFLILLPGCGARAAMARAEHCRAAIGSTPILIAGEPLHVTCSFGLHSVSGGAYESDEAVSKADAALYRAKRMGGDRCVAPHE